MRLAKRAAILALIALSVYGVFRVLKNSRAERNVEADLGLDKQRAVASAKNPSSEAASDSANADWQFDNNGTNGGDSSASADSKAWLSSELNRLPPVEKRSATDVDGKNKEFTLYQHSGMANQHIIRVVKPGLTPTVANSSYRIADHFLVTLETNVTQAQLDKLEDADLVILRKMYDKTYVVGFKNPTIERHLEAFRRLKAMKTVQFVGVDAFEYASVQPSDPFYPLEWHLENQGKSPDKRRPDVEKGVDTKATAAWDISSDCSGKLVAVIDTGADFDHPDIASNMDLTKARNFAPKTFKGTDLTVDPNFVGDKNGHGTHVVGVIAAKGNDKRGVAGVCWKARVVPIRCMDDHGLGSSEYTTRALEYALSSGANIINMSIQSDTLNPQQELLMLDAAKRGIIVVTAAGNYLRDVDDEPVYPGAYSWTINVGNTKGDNKLNAESPSTPAGSNYGARTVDIAAPGTAILSTYPRSLGSFQGEAGYKILTGTSQASPLVAGAIALAWSVAPSLSADRIIELLFSSAEKNKFLNGKIAESRQLDIGSFVKAANESGGKEAKCIVVTEKETYERMYPSEAHCQTYCEVIGPLDIAPAGNGVCKSETKTYYEANSQ
ncbi:MAG: S8 family serine peptidase [Oligoflexales bacterium]